MAACVCVECGAQSIQKLYTQYTGGAIQLMQCEQCGGLLDKYVEYDAVLLLLDLLLLKVQSYRHLLFNYNITTSVHGIKYMWWERAKHVGILDDVRLLCKLSVVLVLCEAYTKLRRLGLDSSDPVTLQVNFHSFFILSILEIVLFYMLSYAILWTFAPPTFKHVLRILVISCSGKLTAIAAMIWTGDFYLWLPLVVVLPAQLQVLRAALVGVPMPTLGSLVLLLNVMIHGVSWLLDGPRTAIVQYLTSGLRTS